MIVYLIVNRTNQTAYVGQTIGRLYDRIQNHCNAKPKSPLNRAIRKYGKDNFDACVLQICSSKEELNEAEKQWIEKLGTIAPNGYNLASGGNSCSGFKLTEERKKTMSESRKGENNPNFGNHKPWTEARRANHMAKPHWSKTPEGREKLRAGRKAAWERNPITEEQKRRLGEIGRGVFLNEESRAKHLAAARDPEINAKRQGNRKKNETAGEITACVP